jgi:hypothetical protein
LFIDEWRKQALYAECRSAKCRGACLITQACPKMIGTIDIL